MEENKINISVLAVEIKSEKKLKRDVHCCKIKQGFKNSICSSAQTHEACPQTNLLILDILGRMSWKDRFFYGSASFLVFRSKALNQSGPKWHAFLSIELPFSQLKESQSFMFQSLSPQPFLLFLQKEEGTAVTHKSSVSRIRVSFSFQRW